MSKTFEIIRGTVILLFFAAVTTVVLIRWLKRSRDDPAVLITKWVLTVPLLAVAFFSVKWFGPYGPFIIAGCGVMLSILWTPNLASWLIKPLTSAIDGGDDEVEPAPFYSIARAHRNKGKYQESVAEVRRQLEKFPNDFEGILLLASLQAENLNDLPGAETTLNRFCEQPGSSPQHITAALHQLADWQLKWAQDPIAARQALERIVALYPDTELARQTAQRIAHLADPEYLLSQHARDRVAVAPGVQNLGLLKDQEHLKTAEADPAKLAAEYVQQLEQHPQDAEAREKLAVLYAEHYGRLDLATDQLEELVRGHPQAPKQAARWLNLLADLQVRCGADYDAVRHTLQTIIDLYPDAAVADTARNRLDHLRLEFKGKEKSQVVALGSYEQNLGLKMKRH